MPDEGFASLPAAERVRLTRQARAADVPLVERWQQLDLAVSEDWLPRARLAANWLAEARSVADLGCGRMLLETCLGRDQNYVPVDFLPRDNRTMVVDFNKFPLPRIAATHFAGLGLLEYLYRLERFLRWLRAGFAGGVVSFSCRSSAPRQRRLANGWVNHHTEPEIRALLQRSGFTVRDALEFRPAQLLFLLE
jgi:hypothetical protein